MQQRSAPAARTYLTAAFRAAGALAGDNRVTGITGFQEVFGGGAGRKLRLDVAYERPAADLPEALFVKFSRDPDDQYRDALKVQMEAEVGFALLTRAGRLPIVTPRRLSILAA